MGKDLITRLKISYKQNYVKYMQPSLIFASKAEAYKSGAPNPA
jgi:hypothetical protein